MRKRLQIPLKIALILLSLGAVSSWAEVKLRIYLQDGTLQAGNLVTETDEAFVILTKDGRSEVKKDKIMFINGKTLRQWQERPDKLFQTEIIPAEIPNPAYVNDKAPVPALPPPVKATPVATQPPATASTPPATEPKPKAKSEPPKKSAPPVVEPASVEPVVEAALSPAPKEVPRTVEPQAVKSAAVTSPPVAPSALPVVPVVSQAAKPVPVVPVPAKKKVRKSTRPVPVVEAPSKPVEPPVVKAKPVIKSNIVANDPTEAIKRPARFVRKDLGDYHFKRALSFAAAEQRGRAIQELHFSTTLDRQNPDAVVLLAKLYLEQGQNVKANKFLGSPIVKKRDDVKQMRGQIESEKKEQKKAKQIFYGVTAVGGLAWIPMLLVLRRLRRPRKRTLIAETMTSAQEVIEEVLGQVSAKSELPSDTALVESPPELASPPSPAFTAFKPPVASSKPVEPPPPPVRAVPPPKKLEPIVPPPLPPPAVPPPIPPPIILPDPVAEVPAETAPLAQLNTEAVLRLTSMVDRTIRQGNALAVENKLDLARREYRTALALNPTCVEAFVGMGYLCFVQGQWELALEHYMQALKIDPNSADAHYGIGRVLLETDRVNDAVQEFQQTLVLDPGFDDARETLTALGAAA